MRSIFHFSFHYLARRRQASARWGRGSARARSPPPGFAQVRLTTPGRLSRARRRRRPPDRLHREILVSRNNVAQIFTRSFNDDGRTMCDAKLRRCDACTPCRCRAATPRMVRYTSSATDPHPSQGRKPRHWQQQRRRYTGRGS